MSYLIQSGKHGAAGLPNRTTEALDNQHILNATQQNMNLVYTYKYKTLALKNKLAVSCILMPWSDVTSASEAL